MNAEELIARLVQARWLQFLFLILLLVTCATMATSFLSFATTNQLIFGWTVPLIVAVNLIAFAILTGQTSKNRWQIDYEANVDNQPR